MKRLPVRPFAQITASKHSKWRNVGIRTFFGLPRLDSLVPPLARGKLAQEQRYHKRRILPYTQKQLYDVVADVDNYYHFVPYCTESKVLTSRHTSPRNGTIGQPERIEKKEARLTVGFMAFKESYVSEVVCRPYESVEAVASSGTPLFRKLVTTWRFQPANSLSAHPVRTGIPGDNSQPLETAAPSPPDHQASDGPTLLSIELIFEFANPVYAAASAAFFKDVSSMMVAAFQKRCVEVYGKGRG